MNNTEVMTTSQMLRSFKKARGYWVRPVRFTANCDMVVDVAFSGKSPARLNDRYFVSVSVKNVPLIEPPKGRSSPWFLQIDGKKEVAATDNAWSYGIDGALVKISRSEGLIGDQLAPIELLAQALMSPFTLFCGYGKSEMEERNLGETDFKVLFSPKAGAKGTNAFVCSVKKNNHVSKFERDQLIFFAWAVKGLMVENRSSEYFYSDFFIQDELSVPRHVEQKFKMSDRKIHAVYDFSEVVFEK